MSKHYSVRLQTYSKRAGAQNNGPDLSSTQRALAVEAEEQAKPPFQIAPCAYSHDRL